MASNQSLNELWRLFLEKALRPGSGTGSEVNVTNDPLRVTPTGPLGTGLADINVANFPPASPVGLTNTELRASPVAVDTGLVTQTNTLTDAQLRASAVGVSVANFPATQPVSGTVTTNSALAAKIGEGKFWIAGHNVTTDATNPQAVFSLVNPATATTNMFVTKIAVDAASAGQILFVRNQTNNPNPIREAFNPNTFFSGQPQGEFHAGNLLPTGGTVISPTRKVFANSSYEFEGLVILRPGQTFSARVTGAATGSQMSGLVHWYQE